MRVIRYCFPAAALVALLLLILLFVVPAWAQFAPVPSGWYWTNDDEQALLWHDGLQHGNLVLDTLTYWPYLGNRQWGDVEDCPCVILEEFKAKYNAGLKRDWMRNGVIGAPGKPSQEGIPNTGLHVRPSRKAPPATRGKAVTPAPPMKDFHQAVIAAGAAEVPAFEQMASLTFVSTDGKAADAALKQFQESPALAKWRDKYGPRAKAYSLPDFQHTSSAFKLADDRQFAEAGFVALVQPDAPDANDRAAVHSIYAFGSAEDFAAALRDADPRYDPNPPDSSPLGGAGWEPWHIATAGGLFSALVLLAVSAAASLRQTN